MADLIVIIVIIAALFLAIRGMIKNKNSCSGGCASCHGGCKDNFIKNYYKDQKKQN